MLSVNFYLISLIYIYIYINIYIYISLRKNNPVMGFDINQKHTKKKLRGCYG